MKQLFSIVAIVIFFISCKKTSITESSLCDDIKIIKAVVSPVSVDIGGTIKFSTTNNNLVAAYEWRNSNFTSPLFGSTQTITSAKTTDRGWYYLLVYNSQCSKSKFDSVYVTVKLPVGTPPCTIANNNINYNNMGTDVFGSISKNVTLNSPLLSLSGNSSTGDIAILFHHYWNLNEEPEDGIYYTTNVPSFSGDFNKVYIKVVKNSISWASTESQPVYVSHVGGKLQVKYCNLRMGGYNGTSFTTMASGNILQTN